MDEVPSDIPLQTLHDLLTPGLRWQLDQARNVRGYLVPIFHSYTLDLVLWSGTKVGANGHLLSAEEIRSGEYKSLFASRVKSAIERVERLSRQNEP